MHEWKEQWGQPGDMTGRSPSTTPPMGMDTGVEFVASDPGDEIVIDDLVGGTSQKLVCHSCRLIVLHPLEPVMFHSTCPGCGNISHSEEVVL
jgi:hypothetical protein